MDKKKKLNIEEIEQMLDRKLTVAEVYANRPHKWIVYTAIVLIIVTLVGWSAADIKFTGLTATGTEVAKGVLHGVFHPDTNLMFGTTNTDVPYLLLQTMAMPCWARCSAPYWPYPSRSLLPSISCLNPWHMWFVC